MLLGQHACDVATDDALFQGVRLGAQIIICAPCCHKEVRRQIEKSMKGRSKAGDEGESEAGEVAMQGLLRHGILLERQAEIVTDAIRALALEIAGYKAQVSLRLAIHLFRGLAVAGSHVKIWLYRPV